MRAAAKEEDAEPLVQEGPLQAQVGIRPCFYWISEASRAEAIESGEDSERTMSLAERSRWLVSLAKGECQDAVLVLPRFHGDEAAIFAGALDTPVSKCCAATFFAALREKQSRQTPTYTHTHAQGLS